MSRVCDCKEKKMPQRDTRDVYLIVYGAPIQKASKNPYEITRQGSRDERLMIWDRQSTFQERGELDTFECGTPAP